MWSSLIRYLTTCRNCMLGRLETEHDSSEGELQLLNTMLILCYLQSGNALVDSFVRLRYYAYIADIAETETMLKQHEEVVEIYVALGDFDACGKVTSWCPISSRTLKIRFSSPLKVLPSPAAASARPICVARESGAPVYCSQCGAAHGDRASDPS